MSLRESLPISLELGVHAFIDRIVASVIRDDPPEQTWASAEKWGPTLLAGTFPPDAPPAAQRAMSRVLARAIADQVPRPSLRYAARKTPRPGRNDLCDCGSGRKCKQCCAPLEGSIPVEPGTLLVHVLRALPRRRWPEITGSAIDPRFVGAAAMKLFDDDALTDVVALLEPWFKGESKIPASHEDMLDALLEAYTALGNPRKKRRLLEAALARGDRTIRSVARQRLAMMAADDGDFEAAWQHFTAAQREHPDSDSLAQLEVVLLMAQGDTAQAKERARFWIARLTRSSLAAHDPLIGFLRQIVEQGEAALLAPAGFDWPELTTLRRMVEHMPTPIDQHRLVGGDDETAGHIEPKTTLRPMLARWAGVFPQAHPGLTAMELDEHPAWLDTSAWIKCLQQHPLLWQSFDVLDDLVLALAAVPVPGVQQVLAEPLLERAELLFDRLVETHNPALKPIEWAWHQNRPALRLLAQRIVSDLDAPSDATVARMERMLALNPNDNHGFRSELMTVWLRRGRFEQAEQLASRYRNDAELGFGRVLALWAMNRPDEAHAQLRQAHARLPRVLPMLLAARPRKPRLQPGFVTHGGADQTWLIREEQRPAWEAVPGALDWLRDAGRTLDRA
jgi:tetratricopeptide (TPR) repeat protein